MVSVLVLIVFLWSFSEVISQCPPSSGIYLMHNGNCYPNGSYFWDTSIRPTPLECVLDVPNDTLIDGQWIGPNGTVPCPGNNSNLICTVGSAGANLSVHIPTTYQVFLDGSGDGWYKCCLPTNCSDPNTNIITANIFKFAQILSFTVTGLSSDMTVYPQEYRLNCTKIGYGSYGISMRIGNTTLASYTNCIDELICSPCPGSVLVSSTNTVRYTVTITWDGMTVTSGSNSQSTAGDQTYQCVLDNPMGGSDRTRILAIKVPATAPSSLTEVNKTATTITVSWTALDSSNADGYVVNVTSDTDTVQTEQVEGTSNNTITLNGLRELTTYRITVRAYQQLLGPASTISVQTLPVIKSINSTLVSSITQLNSTQYRIDCLTTTDIYLSTDVYWLVNGVMKNNSMYSSIDVLTCNNTLLVYPDPLGVSVNVTCIAMIGGVSYSQCVILHSPSGPLNNVRGSILNATSIILSWTAPSETNGFVIEYTGGVTRDVVFTSKDEIVLTDLSSKSTYTISVYSYIDLPSVNSTVTVLRFNVPSPVTSLSVSNVSTTGITVNWTIPSSENYVTYYTISYTLSCPQLSSVNETVSVAPHQSTTAYSYTLISLYSGMNYTITVRAGNVLGGSELSTINIQTEAIIPSGWPSSIQVLQLNSAANNLTWNEVNCSQRNGLITGYTVMISNSSITYNLTSTERNIILNDLVFSTEYNISVAAVNSVGRGPFSDPISVGIGIVPGPVGSVSSTIDTTWAVISWSIPSYIPQDYPIITYEVGYYVIQSRSCSMVDNDIDTQMLQLFNSTNSNRFIIVTDLNDTTCYIFGVRAYTDNGYGKWTAIVNRTLKLPQPSPCFPSKSNASNTSDSFITANSDTFNTVIALGVLVGVLCILLTASVIIHINGFIRKKNLYATSDQQTKLAYYLMTCHLPNNYNNRSDDAIAMQTCEPYEIHKKRLNEENEEAYAECQTSPDDIYEPMPQY
uniref:Fibronectin type-III domain-containing protein n=1 Tax=Amphimedon queenslandica TaxID=400682 RepID=A0A1X7TTH1_AMPQE